MPNFQYLALDGTGKQKEGMLSAAGRLAAIEQLEGKGLHPVSVDEKQHGQGGFKWPWQAGGDGMGKVSRAAAESFTRELGNLLAGGVSLSRSLEILGREGASDAAKKQWRQVRDDVMDGVSLAEAMDRLPGTFTDVNVAMVRAGEAGGFLDVVLSQIAEFRARERDLIGKVRAAMVYPAILTVMLGLVVIFLLTFFIPRFMTIFEDFGEQLPALTLAIVGLSNILLSYGWAVAIAVVAAVWFGRQWAATETGRRKVERVLLKTPGIGVVLSRFALVRFSRMLGTLLGAGVPLVRALQVAREAIGNQTLSDAVREATEQVQAGESLARSLGQCEQLFPPSVIEMVAVAEETGRLDKELMRLALTYEDDLDRQLRMLVAMVEPLLLFVMAAIVGTIVVGMLLPVFTLQDMIQ
ncbi:MAG: type II secretion system F family protein [Phycisphaeraceae bacterium]